MLADFILIIPAFIRCRSEQNIIIIMVPWAVSLEAINLNIGKSIFYFHSSPFEIQVVNILLFSIRRDCF